MNIIKKTYTLLVLIITLLIASDFVYSQQYNITNYNISDGLPGSQIYALHQDKQGYLWIGTYGGGLSKFDGKKFINFSTSNGLPDNRILCLYGDSKGYLWIGTYGGGLSKYDGHKFKNYSKAEGLPSNIVSVISEDIKGNIWLGTIGNGVYIFNNHEFNKLEFTDSIKQLDVWSIVRDNKNMWLGTSVGVFQVNDNSVLRHSKQNGSLCGNLVWKVMIDNNKNIWAGTYGKGACIFQGHKLVSYNTDNGLSNNIVYDILEDEKQRRWFATDGGGVSILEKETFYKITEKNGLSHDRVRCLLKDNENNIWIGTDAGLNKYTGKSFTVYNKESGVSDKKILSVMEDSRGNIWLGTFGSGVNKLSFEKGVHKELSEIEYFDKSNGLSGNRVWCMMQDSKGVIWLGTTSGITTYNNSKFSIHNNKTGLPINTIYALMEDKAGNIWIGGDGGLSVYNGKGFKHYSVSDGISHHRVRSIVQDTSGTIWIGTYGGGVTKYDGNNFSKLYITDWLDKSIVYSLAIDNTNNLWIGTYGNGIIKYNLTDKTSDYFNKEHGLADNSVLLLNLDKGGDLWIGTITAVQKFYLCKYNLNKKKEFKVYEHTDGFKGIECNQNAAITDANNNTWFGTQNGVIRYTRGEEKNNLSEPYTHISGIRLFFEKSNFDNFCNDYDSLTRLPINLKLPYNKNHLTFDFIGISYTDPNRVKYLFYLEGFDQKWSPPTVENHVTYSNLPPGQYTFHIKSCNENSVCNKIPVSYSFVILAPFWLRWWFLPICVLFIGVMVYSIYRYRTNELKRTSIELEKQVKIRTKELFEQAEKLEKGNKEKEMLLKEVHHRVKNNLQIISSMLNLQSNNINDEKTLEILRAGQMRVMSMALVHQMLYQAKDMFSINLQQYTQSLCDNVSRAFNNKVNDKLVNINIVTNEINFNIDTVIPLGLIINELVTNSFKYAFKPSNNYYEISITVEKGNAKNEFLLIYKDNGVGLPENFSFDNIESLGLDLVKTLSEQLDGSFRYENNNGACFTIIFKPIG